ncbi:hypothetical protein K474DRAFT_1624159 [Panus rudis PR-1116 ss-1]|nr:hypothetical protein K474DRAFT_1624159 [Panus rudis PR-1116 ss-1]
MSASPGYRSPPPSQVGASSKNKPTASTWTPVANKIQGCKRAATVEVTAKEHHHGLADEAFGEILASMPVELFFALFMTPASGLTKMVAVKKNVWDSIPTGAKIGETSMYPKIRDAINNSGFLRDKFRMAVVSSKLPDSSIKVRSDLFMYEYKSNDIHAMETDKEKSEGANDSEQYEPSDDEKLEEELREALAEILIWDSIESSLEVKREDLGDWCHIDLSAQRREHEPPEKNDQKSKETQGQILHYFTIQSSHQHRSFIIGFAIFGDHIRFYRYDRAGLIVSEPVFYKKRPEIFAEFLWRYSHLSREERGYDTSVEPASAAESELLTQAVRQCEKDALSGHVRWIPNIASTLDKTYRSYKAYVYDEATGRIGRYVIRRPIAMAESPFGRATRGYIALDLESDEKELVFLKDTWRVSEDDFEKEGEIYQFLDDHDVANVATPMLAGDVLSRSGSDDEQAEGHRLQVTVTQEWANMRPRPSWRYMCWTLRRLTHYRLVLPLYCTLDCIENAKELVKVIRDVTQALVDVYSIGTLKRLHRDVTADNILFDAQGAVIQGLLADWDHSRTMAARIDSPLYRTGSWYALSIALLRDTKKLPGLEDDLESIYWVLLYVSVHSFAHTGRAPLGIFNDGYLRLVRVTDEAEDDSQGAKKLDFLYRPRDLVFTCPALQQLFVDLRSIWIAHYRPRKTPRPAKYPENIAAKMLNYLDNALAKGPNEWTNAERTDDKYKAKRAIMQARALIRDQTQKMCAHRDMIEKKTQKAKDTSDLVNQDKNVKTTSTKLHQRRMKKQANVQGNAEAANVRRSKRTTSDSVEEADNEERPRKKTRRGEAGDIVTETKGQGDGVRRSSRLRNRKRDD